MPMKKGFTLIELLTVVLIVSILTAVALPQYRRVVQKSRAAEAESMLRIIYDSSERLAGEFGYRSYDKLVEAKGATTVGFTRLDMFDGSNLPAGCKILSNKITLDCTHFSYRISILGYVAAKIKPTTQNKWLENTYILLNRSNMELVCQGTEDACDILGLDLVSAGVSF